VTVPHVDLQYEENGFPKLPVSQQARGMSDEEEFQKQLSFRWETKDHWPGLRKEFGVTKTGAAMILSLVTTNDWVTYSRRWQHYSLPRRYRNPLYTYRRVVGAADYLAAHNLLPLKVDIQAEADVAVMIQAPKREL
jgi:hypothetical protein